MQFSGIGELLIYRDCWSQRTLATGALPEGYLVIGGSAQTGNSIDWCGSELSNQRLALASGGVQCDFIIPAQAAHLVLLVPLPLLEASFGEETASLLRHSTDHHFQCDPQLGARFLGRLQWILDRCTRHPQLLESPAEQQALQNSLLNDLAELGLGRRNSQRSISPSTKRQVLRCVANYSEPTRAPYSEPTRAPISVPEFARKLNISQRCLELALKECLGITPRQFLYRKRLHNVHKELQLSQPQNGTITEVATSWGFSELGRFAGDYRHLFGELPSATLKKHRASKLVRLSDILR